MAQLLIIFAIVAFALWKCDASDSDYVPYFMKGLRVFVYDNDKGTEHFAGEIEASYFSKDEALRRCNATAYSTASAYQMKNWGYVCCTVTSSSNCYTKVR